MRTIPDSFSPILSSIIGGSVVVVLTAILNMRRDRIMKRDPYREILYREKIRAYTEIHTLAVRVLLKTDDVINRADRLSEKQPDVWAQSLLEDAAAPAAFGHLAHFHEAIQKSSFFMTKRALETIRTFNEITEHLLKTPSITQGRYELPVQPSQDYIRLLTAQEEVEAISDVLKEELGFERLTQDMEDLFSPAPWHGDIVQRVGSILKKARKKKIPKKPTE